MLSRYNDYSNEPKLPEPLLSGKDLIKLGLKPGPEFKEILHKISDLQLDNKISSKTEAIKYVYSFKEDWQ